ncbi:hypothetical protein FB446DRAFT_348522 [Lentinula raphanica]|nr:hypothetical protein FB446DRAFT_348522 [Lentinula raphanica]
MEYDLLIFVLVVLTIRTWVLWKKDIKLSFGLPLFYICCWMPIFYGLNQFLQSLIFIPSPIPQVSGCAYLGGQKIFYICWVFLAVYEVGMLILMFIPGFRLFYLGHGSGLTKIVYRDGIIYYIFLVIWSAINAVASISLSGTSLETVLSTYQRVMHTVLTSRAILHIRSSSNEYIDSVSLYE